MPFSGIEISMVAGQKGSLAIKHRQMSDKNPHWDIDAELMRRGGHRNIPYRVLPANIAGVADQHRANNQRKRGGNRLFLPKPGGVRLQDLGAGPPDDRPSEGPAWLGNR